MRSCIIAIALLLVSIIARAQAPVGIPYQAAARNSSGSLLASTAISVRFTIRDSVSSGAIKYRETHSVTTNTQGMFSVNVGHGTPVSGTFTSIKWGVNGKFMQVEIDPAGGSSYIDMGTQQMMSVPYALNSGSLKLTASTTGDTLYSGGGNYVIVPGISGANTALPSAGTITSNVTVCLGSTIVLYNATSGGVWSSSATGVATVNSTGTVTGLSAGSTIISYTVTNSFGSATTTIAVTVVPILSAGTITGTATVCAGSTTLLSNIITGGTWISGAASVATVGSTGIVNGISAGLVTISYTVNNSCGSSTATRIVTVNPLPSAGTITGTATVSAGSTTVLSNAVTGGTWSSSASGIATVGSTGIVSGVAAGTVIISYTVSNACGNTLATQVVTVNAVTIAIGVTYGGGIIAYILMPGDPGYVAGETHGLIVAPTDQSTGIVWGCYGSNPSGTSTALGAGAANTTIISSTCGAGTAARLCADLILGGYNDWFLPSTEELNKLYTNRTAIGGFSSSASSGYWSSCNIDFLGARVVYLGSTGTTGSNGKNSSCYVRAVRSF